MAPHIFSPASRHTALLESQRVDPFGLQSEYQAQKNRP